MTCRPSCKISVVIPAYHEAHGINALVRHLRERDRENCCEIIVVDGDAEQGTLEAIRDPGVRKITSAKGRARQMNAGAAIARGDILVFLHADTHLPHGAFERVLPVIDGGYDAGAFGLGFDVSRWPFGLLARLATWWSRLTRLPFGDQAIFISRRCFEQCGGYRDIPIMEELDLMRRVNRGGGRVRIVGECVRTSSRRFVREGPLRCAGRNCVLVALYFFGVPPFRLNYYYPDDYPLSPTDTSPAGAVTGPTGPAPESKTM